MEDVSEAKDEVKGEDVTGSDEAVGMQQGESGDGGVKTLEDKGVNEDESTLQSDQGAGDFHPNEETEGDAEQDECLCVTDGENGEGEQKEENDDGETGAQIEDILEQEDVQIEDELRRSKRTDEGDEVVSSKVTTVSFASEVQVLTEDDIEEQWTTTGGDNGVEDANKEDDDTEGIIESSENKSVVVENTANVASAADSERDEVAGAPVSVEGDSNELENIPAFEQEQPPIDTTESAAPVSGVAVTVVEKASEELNINTTQQNQAVEQEQSLPETNPLGDAGVVTGAPVGEGTNTAEQDPEAKHEEGHEDKDGELDNIPVLQLTEEKQEKHAPEYVKVVHRSMKSSAPVVTLEASMEYSEELSATEVIETEEGKGSETHASVPVLQYEEVESENHAFESGARVRRNLEECASDEDVVATTAIEVNDSQEDSELGNLVQSPEGDLIGVEVNGVGVDNHTELEADSALPDENQMQLDNQQDELYYYQDLTDPPETSFDTVPNLSSTNQEDVPLHGNFSEYEQHPMLPSDVDPLPPIEPELFRQDVHQEDQRMDGLSPIELLTQANQAHGRLPLRSPHHQQHPRSGSKLESTSRATSLSRIQIARIPSPPAHVKAQMIMDEERRASTRTSSRLPPSVMKMSSVMVNARKKALKNRDASVYYEERQFHKVLTLDECINSRPPMQFDLDTPGPCQYSPRNKPLYEDNAPEFSFGMKFPERGGGGRTAYAKTWFNSRNNYTVKTRFERRWPSPNAYGSGRSLVGSKVPDKKDYPSFSMRAKTTFNINKKGSENEPGPDQYQRQNSDPLLYRRAPAFSMGAKLDRGRLFGAPEITPAPNYYSPHTKYTSRKITYPAFTISGVRKPKSHALGPHATL